MVEPNRSNSEQAVPAASQQEAVAPAASDVELLADLTIQPASGTRAEPFTNLRERPLLDSTINLTQEQFEARSISFIAPEKRDEARAFVARALGIHETERQNEHLFKVRLKEFNPDATATLEKWDRFNRKANSISAQVSTSISARVLQDPALRARQLERSLDFIDARHQDDAYQTVVAFALDVPPEDRHLLLPIHYQKGLSPVGRFEPGAWRKFNLASTYLDRVIASGEVLSVQHVLELNALLQTGKIPERRTDIIRTRFDVSGVFRSTADLVRVFDEEGRYKSDLFASKAARPQMLGFCTQRQFFQDAARYLQEMHFQRPDLARYRVLTEKVRELMQTSPHELAEQQENQLFRTLHERHKGDRDLMIKDFQDPNIDFELKRQRLMFNVDRAEIKEHLNEALQTYMERLVTIAQQFDSVEKLASNEQQTAFKRAVVELAVEFGSVIDIGHFALDGMGRSNLLLERAVIEQCGLKRPSSLDVVYDGIAYENGTYVPKNVRIDAILARMPSFDADKVFEKFSLLAQKSKQALENTGRLRIKIRESDYN